MPKTILPIPAAKGSSSYWENVSHHLVESGVAIAHYPRYVNRDVRLHNPRLVLLSFIARGHGWHVLGDDVYEEHGGSVGITHYGQLHDVITDEAGMEIYNVFVDPEHQPLPRLPDELAEILPEILPLHPCFQNRLNRMVRLELDEPERAATYLRAILREQEEQAPGHREARQHQFSLFLIQLCRQAKRNGIPLEQPLAVGHTPWVERLRRHLETHFAAEHTLEGLAARAGVSSVYLCRAFKRYTGKTLFEYLLHRRIQAAMLRLRNTDEKIMSIALECGFNDLSYFNRRFRQLVGASPGQYRRAAPALPQGPAEPAPGSGMGDADS